MASPAGNPTVSAHFRFNLLTGKTDEQQESSRLAANGHESTIKLTPQSAYSRVNSASIGQQTEEIYIGVWLLLRVLTLS